MALADRGALGLLVVAALVLAAGFMVGSRAPAPPSWKVYWDEGGEARWTTDKSIEEGVRLEAGRPARERVGGRLGLLVGTRLNPATADFDDWLVLPGVGEKTAAEILSARERLGGFNSTGDLIEAKGIGPKKLEKLSPWLGAP